MSPARLIAALALCAALAAPLSVQAQTYLGTFSGENEAPPNASTGTGSVVLVLDGNLLGIEANFSGLGGLTTAAHIHCCAPPGSNAAVAINLSLFPVGVSEGQHVQVIDLAQSSSYSVSFITNNGGDVEMARAQLVAALDDGHTYYNIHTTTFPGGEIRANPLRLDLFADGFEAE